MMALPVAQNVGGTMVSRIECIEGVSRNRQFPLRGRRTIIGRSSTCDVCLDANEELGVSGRHCEIRVIGDVTTIEDCGSTNGTLLAGKRITEPTVLKDGANFRLGRKGPIFRFHAGDANPPTSKEHVQKASERGGQARTPPSPLKWKVLFFVSLAVIVYCTIMIVIEMKRRG